MKEYKDAMAQFRAIMEAKKKEIAEQCRPIFIEGFRPFFEATPEIESIGFRVATGVYDDEGYNDEIENIHYVAVKELDPDQDEHDMDYGLFHGLHTNDYEVAAGQVSSSYDRYGPSYRQSAIEAAQERVATHEALVAKLGDGGVDRVQSALREVHGAIEGVDIEFAKIVFGADKQVSITREGVTIH